jgi:UDP-N-acetylmuramoylalanine--D-glutamate ligase
MNGSSALQALSGKRIVILGCGVNNAALAVWLTRQGLQITVRDQKEEAKAKFIAEHGELSGIEWQIMPNILEGLTDFDVAFRTPFIPYHDPVIQQALQAGVQITSQTKLFFQLCPCEIIGITGSKGKGTAATLTHRILQAGYKKGQVYLAGNIGINPFSFVDELTENDLVVLELSSFQLTDLHVSPSVGVMLNVVPEHLDHHKTFAAYRAAKGNLLKHQREGDVAIINTEHPANAAFYLPYVQGRLLSYTLSLPQRESAWVEYLDGKEVVFAHIGETLESFDTTARRLKGHHNLENIIPAILVGIHYNIDPLLIQKEVVHFPGLEHRLMHLGSWQRVDFYDDSIGTTPEASEAAMQAFEGRRIHLLAGGKTKGQEFTHWANQVAERCASVTLLPGVGTAEIDSALIRVLRQRTDCNCDVFRHPQDPVMEHALRELTPHFQSGDVVLLSPAAASDAPFANYKERGEAFAVAFQILTESGDAS